MKGTRLASCALAIGFLTAAPCASVARSQEHVPVADSEAPFASGAHVGPALPDSPVPPPDNWFVYPDRAGKRLVRRFASDQREIWTSPGGLRLQDAEWLVPVAGIMAGSLLTDRSFTRSLASHPATLDHYDTVRTGGVAAFGAVSGGLFLLSLKTHDPHQRETGWLAGEAVLDSLLVTESLGRMTGRRRPDQGNGQGHFLSAGDSFPSSHSAAAWAAAGILAHEYPGTLTKILAYGLAATVSIASVGSKQHFPSDVLVGSGIGWLVSEAVYRRNHDAQLGGAAWNPVAGLFHADDSGPTRYPGSPYVPLDSWIYPAFDRLAAFHHADGAFEDTRPWTRAQCVQLLLDAEQSLNDPAAASRAAADPARELLLALHQEFAREEQSLLGGNRAAEVDSLYSRVLSASGAVLKDGYHFGQTYSYDFGRPFRQGTNLIAGGSASATYGSLFFYVSGEYQQSPSAPALTAAEAQFIADRDKVSVPPETPASAIHQFELLDAYVGTNLSGWQITFGNQSLSWGPGIGGSLLLSNNAAPLPMLRIAPAEPVEIPGLSRILGPFHLEQFYGRLAGHAVLSEPWIYGQKVSFKPFRSLEFSYGRTTLIGGSGHPLTAGNFLNSLIGRVDPVRNSVPGDSRSSIDWTWRIPGLHNGLTFYGELEDDDDLIPLQNVSKSVLRPGLYLPHLPFLPKWDLHVEWTSSTTPGRASFQNHGDLNYWNLDYPDGYTNNGSLMGNVVGREGVTLQGLARYWISPRNTLDLSWKQTRVLSDFVPGGGKWQDYQAAYSVTTHSGIYLKSLLQWEHIASYPLLFSGSRNNLLASLEIGFYPQWARHPSPDGAIVPQAAHPADGVASR